MTDFHSHSNLVGKKQGKKRTKKYMRGQKTKTKLRQTLLVGEWGMESTDMRKRGLTGFYRGRNPNCKVKIY